jgi:adenylyl-sulfate kinase
MSEKIYQESTVIFQHAAENIYCRSERITRVDRETLNGHKAVTIWLTGLSGSGKSTVAEMLEERLFKKRCQAIVLDGDNVRHGLNKDLGFTMESRKENIRRVSELAKLMTSKGIITIVAFISPYRQDRTAAMIIHEKDDFIEAYLNCPLAVCEKRDPKGLYKRVRAGEITGFTGIDDPYDIPEKPEVVLDTWKLTPDDCVEKIIYYLKERGVFLWTS